MRSLRRPLLLTALGVALAGVWVACSPPRLIGDRVRTSPDLVPLADCEPVVARLRSNLGERYRTLVTFRGRQLLGDVVNDAALYDEPLEVTSPAAFSGGGPSDASVKAALDAADRLWTLRGGLLEVFDLSASPPERLAATEVRDVGTRLLLDEDRRRAFVVSRRSAFNDAYDDVERPVGEPAANGPIRSTVEVQVLTLDAAEPTGLREERRLTVDGDFLAIVAEGDAVWLGAWYTPWLDVTPWPSTEFPFIGVTAAVEDTQIEVEQQLANTPDAQFLPRLSVDDAVVEDACAQTFSADDSTAGGVLSLVRMDADLDVERWSVLATRGVSVGGSSGRIVVAEPSQGSWWYWRNDEHEVASNVHLFDAASERFLGSSRVFGSIIPSGLLAVDDGLALATTNSVVQRAGGNVYDDTYWEEREMAWDSDPLGSSPPRTWLTSIKGASVETALEFPFEAETVVATPGALMVTPRGEQGVRWIDLASLTSEALSFGAMRLAAGATTGDVKLVAGYPGGRRQDTLWVWSYASGDHEPTSSLTLAAPAGDWLSGDAAVRGAATRIGDDWMVPMSFVEGDSGEAVEKIVALTVDSEGQLSLRGALEAPPTRTLASVHALIPLEDQFVWVGEASLSLVDTASLEVAWRYERPVGGE